LPGLTAPLRYGGGVSGQLPGFRTSSARRGRRGLTLLGAAVLAIALLAGGLALRNRALTPREEQHHAQPPDAVPTAPAAATAAATVTPTTLIEESSGWVELILPTATPSPWPTLAPASTATPRPPPSPTPRAGECVIFRWSAQQVLQPSAHVLVEIDADNRCSRDLEPFDLWFEISGWRQGGRVQSVRGHPFERIRRGASGVIAIGLPGSIDWYDEVRVEIVD
jgi:hypothetical protein